MENRTSRNMKKLLACLLTFLLASTLVLTVFAEAPQEAQGSTTTTSLPATTGEEQGDADSELPSTSLVEGEEQDEEDEAEQEDEDEAIVAFSDPLPIPPADSQVGTLDLLKTAISTASEGDVIGITADITLDAALAPTVGITLVGIGGRHTLHAPAGQTWHIETASALTLQNLQLEGTGISGGVKTTGALVMDNVIVKSSNGVKVENADATVSNCRFEDNMPTYPTNRGALTVMGTDSSTYPTFVMTDTDFVGNKTNNSLNGGAGLHLMDLDSVTITGGSFTNNHSAGDAGAARIALIENGAVLTNVKFANNSCNNVVQTPAIAVKGGALFAGAVALTLNNVDFTDNVVGAPGSASTGYGGALFITVNNTTININGGSFVGNTQYNGDTIGEGGAIYIETRVWYYGSDNSVMNITGTKFSGNTNADEGTGAAVAASDLKRLNISGCIFSGNESARSGGAVYHYGSASHQVELYISGNTAFTGNKGHQGSAVNVNYALLNIKNTTFTGNIGGASGAVDALSTPVTIEDSRFENNTSGSNAAICMGAVAGSLTLKNVTFHKNVAESRGGAIGSSAAISAENCVFTENIAKGSVNMYEGGAVYGYVDDALYPNAVFKFTNCTFDKNEAQGGFGGALSLGGAAVEISGGSITNNRAMYGYAYHGGGGLFVEDATSVKLENLEISGNTAVGRGAGAYLHVQEVNGVTQPISLSNVTVSDNETTSGDGGGLFADSPITVNGGRIEGNKAAYSGGGLYLRGANSTGTLTGTVVSSNTAAGNGGGIKTDSAPALTLTNVQLTGNVATGNGGGVHATGEVTLSGGSASGNRGRDGAALFVDAAKLTATGTSFSKNIATNSGGGMFLTWADDSTLTNLVFEENVATNNRGGAVLLEASWDVTITGGRMEGNTSGEFGGAVYNDESITTIDGTSFKDNETVGSGGAIYLVGDNAELEITGTASFGGNTAAVNGGAIGVAWAQIENLEVGASVVFSGNTAASSYTMTALADIGVHSSHVYATSFTSGFTYGYNNYDIEYTRGALNLTITYHKNDGTTLTVTQPVQQNVAFSLRGEATFTREGNALTAWNTQANGGGITYAPGQGGVVATANMDLYAVWSRRTYKVTYIDNNGTGATSVANITYGDRVPSRSVSYSGYELVGWTSNVSGGYWNFSSTMPARDLVLTAQWRKVDTSTPEPGTSSSSSSTITSPGGSSSQPAASSSQAASEAPASSEVPPAAPSGSETVGSALPQTSESEGRDGGVWNIFGIDVPTGGMRSTDGWSLLNLMLSILALASALLLCVRILVRRRGNMSEYDDLESGGAKRSGGILRWVALGTGVLPMLFFFLLENFTQVMLLSKWTPLCIVLTLGHFACHILSAVLSRNTSRG